MIAILSGLAVLTVWGLVAPRGQWRVLAGWTRRDPNGSEPGPVFVGIHRLVAAIAVVALGFGAYTIYGDNRPTPPPPPARTSEVQLLWGAPDPLIVNRVFPSLQSAPSGLAPQTILRYQEVDGVRRDPSYLFGLKDWKRANEKTSDGYIGSLPQTGLTALDTADLVVQVRGDKLCVPYQVVAIETDTQVRVSVYYGQPNAPGSGNDANVAVCRGALADKDTVSVLIPIDLPDPVLERKVVNLDGTPIMAASAKR